MRLHDHPGSLSDVQGIHHYKKLYLKNTASTLSGVVEFLSGTRKPVLWYYPVAFCLRKYYGKITNFYQPLSSDVQLFKSQSAFTTLVEMVKPVLADIFNKFFFKIVLLNKRKM